MIALLKVNKWSSCRGAILWTIGRLGARLPAYGPLNSVVEATTVSRWLEALLRHPLSDANYGLALMLCARRVNDRYRDIPDELRDEVLEQMRNSVIPEHYITLVRHGGQLEGEETAKILGDSLPLGLRINK